MHTRKIKGLDFLEWIKATIKTTTQGIEIATELLADLGIYGVEINDPTEVEAFFKKTSPQWDYVDSALLSPHSDGGEVSVIFYTGTDHESQALLAHVNKALTQIQSFVFTLHLETVNDQDWLHEWKKHFHPIKIGRVIIAPVWEMGEYKDDIVFTIDPGSAFGTGQHATTRLCTEALQEHIKTNDSILDIGCGSGILSVIGLLLGAKHVTACDIDPAAVEITKKNAKLNPIDLSKLEVYVGDILTSSKLQEIINSKSYDIIVANIVADVIIKLSPVIRRLLKPGGVFIASGIIDERLDDVLSALSTLNSPDIKSSEGWCCVVANG